MLVYCGRCDAAIAPIHVRVIRDSEKKVQGVQAYCETCDAVWSGRLGKVCGRLVFMAALVEGRAREAILRAIKPFIQVKAGA